MVALYLAEVRSTFAPGCFGHGVACFRHGLQARAGDWFATFVGEPVAACGDFFQGAADFAQPLAAVGGERIGEIAARFDGALITGILYFVSDLAQVVCFFDRLGVVCQQLVAQLFKALSLLFQKIPIQFAVIAVHVIVSLVVRECLRVSIRAGRAACKIGQTLGCRNPHVVPGAPCPRGTGLAWLASR